MKKHLLFFCVLTFLPFLLANLTSAEEKQVLTMKTYMPAPFGTYDHLQLYPRGPMDPPPEQCQPGMMYIEAGSPLKFHVCGATGQWDSDIGIGPWTQKADKIFLADQTTPNLKVGIGTTNPQYALEIGHNGKIYGSGLSSDIGNGNNLTSIFYWNPLKGSLRAGTLRFNTTFNDGMMGDASIAIGSQTVASGYRSVAIGSDLNATGVHSFALGQTIDVSGGTSIGINLNAHYPHHQVSRQGVIAIMGTDGVGIGATDPKAMFHINSAALDGASGSQAQMLLTGAGDGIPDDSYSGLYLGSQSAAADPTKDTWAIAHKKGLLEGKLTIGKWVDNALGTVLTVEQGGQLGIGTLDPARKLHVHNASSKSTIAISGGQGDPDSIHSQLMLSDENEALNGQSWFVAHNHDNTLRFRYRPNGSNNGTNFMTIKNNGNVGIGTTNPDSKMEIYNNTDSAILTLKGQVGNPNYPASSALILDDLQPNINGADPYWVIANVYTGISEQNAGLAVARYVTPNIYSLPFFIRKDGIIGVNTSFMPVSQIPFNNNTRMYIQGNMLVSGCYRAGNSVSSSAIVGGVCASDLSLKKNILPLQNVLPKFVNLQPVSYDWKDQLQMSNHKEIGLIAQEVEKSFPELVSEDPTTGIKQVMYGNELQMLAIQAIKELKHENDALKEIVCRDHPKEKVCQK